MNFHFSNNVTLIGGGECNLKTLDEALTWAPTLIAADGGAGQALALGRVPELVIGDMDSLDDSTLAALPRQAFYKIAEQDSTDFDKALRSVSAPVVLGVGFLGGRLDHQLACLNALVRHPERPCILLGPKDICFHVPKAVELELPPGCRVSLFPLTNMVAQAEGLVHPVDALPMCPGGKIGTSNEVGPEAKVRLSFKQSGMLVMLPRFALAEAIRALTETGKAR